MVGIAWFAILIAIAEATEPVAKTDFTRDIRPILSDNCFQCHGPDDATREAELRLDRFDSEGDVRGAEEVIIAAAPEESELVARITSNDEAAVMPPLDSGKKLSPEQIETLRQWVADGARYQQHWAFVAPQRSPLPDVKQASWVRNPIDAFVLARLEQEGIRPSLPASEAALLRRLSLDLIGLPPSLVEIESFGAPSDRGAEERYKHEVDRLLASPNYGERWGRLWLDAARYADSDGYEKDKPREVWMYRDWVISSLNEDLPYDEFVVDQIAGDLLPQATQDQHVATGFLRNSMINEEGGIDPEQFRMEAMYDRMDAIGKAVLGLTIQCAQCHTHKYDPLSHTDYYRMFAFLNNCHEGQISVHTDVDREEWRTTAAIIDGIETRLRELNPDWPALMAAWEASVRDDQPEWTIVRPELDSSGGQKHNVQEDGSIRAEGYAPTIHTSEFSVDVKGQSITAIRLELLNDPNLPHGGPGRSIYGLCALTEFRATATPLTDPAKGVDLKFKEATADVNPPERELDKAFDDLSERRRVTGPVAYANDGNELTAWGLDTGAGRSNVPHQAVFVLEKSLDCQGGMRITFKLAQEHGGWNSDDNQNNNLGCFRFAVTSADKAKADPVPVAVREILRVPAAARTPEQIAQVFGYWRTTVDEWEEENRRIDALWESHPRGTTQLVLIERDQPRKTHRLDRGSFLAPAEEVTPGVPSFLHPLREQADETEPANRLDFARWLVDRRSPTAARAIVNRVWQAYFGTGLVGTAEDFGTQGDAPTHPELLDWLAVELMDNGWSLKHIHRLIVNSATYRQTSVMLPELFERDPTNRLLARGARHRLDAEIVRDVALAASGLLTRTVGGPSVYPPAPEFLFQPPTSYGPKTWHYDVGRDKYRRGVYTFRYRSVPHPALQNFDAPVGEISCVRRVRSNTPLQALTTLNEPLFLECARALATQALAAGGETDAERLEFVVRSCVSRRPGEPEQKVLQEFLQTQRARFGREGADPWALLIDENGDRATLSTKMPGNTTPAEMAAWTALARVVLNLDETITKE